MTDAVVIATPYMTHHSWVIGTPALSSLESRFQSWSIDWFYMYSIFLPVTHSSG